jgi:4-hydroxy-tetrahydrodipicolinate reductase
MKIALVGYGKMGKAIEEIALSSGHTIGLKINSSNPADLNQANLSRCDVAIEFTNPHVAAGNILKCIESGIPVISGSTGWLDRLDEISKKVIALDGSFLYASNFSIGVNIFFELNKKLASLMKNQKDYDVTMEEIHHTQKKDAPSGTAITLAEQIITEAGQKKKWINKETSDKSELAIISRRVDPTPGTHLVSWNSPVDNITITHTAHNRQGFARGAVMAAEFIRDKKGIFTMKDVLQIS